MRKIFYWLRTRRRRKQHRYPSGIPRVSVYDIEPFRVRADD